jgi:LmbE family N-acetylglucosaminyl deacetylase
MKKFFLLLLSIVFCYNILMAQQPVTYTSTDIYLHLKKLKVLGSVLYIAAHPDDENNALLPYLAKEKMYRTAYLSLTRGDGGQNLIGNEQGVDLGLIRTQELLAARKIDGAEQYFSRAYEFGYSKTSDETLKIWDKEKVLSDVVWIIRKFQPDVIITRFPPDARAGHGHHQASAILANEAFFDAADSTKFPEQFKYGVKPHQAKRIVWNTYNFGGNNTTNDSQLKIDIGGYNSWLGKSYGEIGAEARTMHKSQGEGRPRRRGQLLEYFSHTAGDTAKLDLLDGIDMSWKKFPNGNKIEGVIDLIISRYNFEKPENSIPSLVQLYKGIQAILPSNWRDKKLQEVQAIIEACCGLFVEATTSQEYVVQGDSLKATFFINNRKGVNASLKKIQMEGLDSTFVKTLLPNENVSFTKSFYVPQDKPLTQLYWLQEPQEKGMFVVKNQTLIGNADSKPAYELNFTVNIEGVNFIIPKSIQYKYVDPVKGELYQPLQVLPIATVEVDDEEKMVRENLVDVSLRVKSYKPNISLYHNYLNYFSRGGTNKVSDSTIKFFNGKSLAEINYTLPLSNKPYHFYVFENFEKVNVENKTLHQIKYDHIPTITYFTNAKINTHKLDVKTAGNKIGYIVGAGDKVPEALQQLGYSVDVLNEKDVNVNNLIQYQAIITGIRAYNLNEWLTSKNEVINEYIKNGGNLIIQYLRNNLVNGKKIQVGPYPFTVNAQSRVTEEDAIVNFNLPNHSVLNFPNKITTQDFDGWIQERSTYQAENLDANFETPLSMNDKNDKPSKGSLAIAKYGKGNVAYLSLAMFRQLPAGVAGAYRLMANLIALPQNKN